MSNEVIQLKNVSKDYNIYKTNLKRIGGIIFGRKPSEVKHALYDINLSVEKGEKVAVFGAVESGCSTLARLISGVTYPTSGRIKTKGTINAFLNTKAGMDDELSCRDNIRLKGIVTNISQKELKKKEGDILRFADAEKYAELPLRRAPKGTNIRLALAVHLQDKSDIFIVDQSFNSGGVESRKICEDALRNWMICNPEITVVLATSRIAFAKKVCSRAIILDKGRIVFDGDAEEGAVIFKERYYKRGIREAEDDSQEEDI